MGQGRSLVKDVVPAGSAEALEDEYRSETGLNEIREIRETAFLLLYLSVIAVGHSGWGRGAAGYRYNVCGRGTPVS